MLEVGAHFINITKACVIFGTVTILGVLTLYFTPEDQWLPHDRIAQALYMVDDTGRDD